MPERRGLAACHMAGSSIGESAAIQSPDIDNLTLLLHIAISLILLLRDTLPQLA